MAGEKEEPPNSREQGPGSEGELPDPDLNPMMNPTLSRNLGMWAHVYFMNPPEKRAQAVAELLRELEGTPGGNGTPDNQHKQEQAGVDLKETAARVPAVPNSPGCPECGRVNAPDHWFCGFCGSPLKGTALKRGRAAVSGSMVQGGNGSVAASEPSGKQHPDVEWLREKSVPGWEKYQAGRHNFRKILALSLAVAAIGFLSFEWRNRAGVQTSAHSAINAASAATSPSPTQAASSSAAVNRPSPGSGSSEPPSEPGNRPSSEKNDNSATAELSKAPLPPSSTAQSSVQSPENTGNRELAVAEEFLKGGTRARDAAEAAKWLWKSVSKQNAVALVLLADLYERGDGVPKSCDQAEILLVAAAKKGSVEAGQRLRNLHSSECK